MCKIFKVEDPGNGTALDNLAESDSDSLSLSNLALGLGKRSNEVRILSDRSYNNSESSGFNQGRVQDSLNFFFTKKQRLGKHQSNQPN